MFASSRRLVICRRLLSNVATATSTSTSAAPSTSAASTSTYMPTMSSLFKSTPFQNRHIGPSDNDISSMLTTLSLQSLNELAAKAIPADISNCSTFTMPMDNELTESEALSKLKSIATQNKPFRSFIGYGYVNAVTPTVIQRNLLENPQWYTQYTPYQPEISQGRLESLLNFQTIVCDMTGMNYANASLLDEGTSAGEAVFMFYNHFDRERKKFFVDTHTYSQTIACLKTRASGFGVEVVVDDFSSFMSKYNPKEFCGVLVQYPNATGSVTDYQDFFKKCKESNVPVACATDLLACTLLTPPGEIGADVVFGNSQRFGVPMGFGGPHAAFFACKDEFKRKMPGRLVGVSKDALGNVAYRLTLQTREQHIRREKATSNICTAQALLANIAAMYCVYHGPQGLKKIAQRVHNMTALLADYVQCQGLEVTNKSFFDTLRIKCDAELISKHSLLQGINVMKIDGSHVQVTLDESVTPDDFSKLTKIFTRQTDQQNLMAKLWNGQESFYNNSARFPDQLKRTSSFLTHPVFNTYHSETEMLRYLTKLQKKDLSLADAMIPLGSCTMKLNATSEMLPLTWPELSNVHPFAPIDQAAGYMKIIKDLESDLAIATGFNATSLQPNSGAQGEYTGLMAIRAYQKSIGQGHRNICLIPVSAHGTNPASAVMAGLKVVAVKCDALGNLDKSDLEQQVKLHEKDLCCIMITYPSTFGVFEEGVDKICNLIHAAGGQVYMDGANLNAQIGLTSPGKIGADVCHLNLHKTFCIPHGGGGPGVGPIAVRKHLAPFLPNHPLQKCGGSNGIGPVSAAPFGSASLLVIPWMYIKMMGPKGLKKATQVALLNANYMAQKLKDHYKILYKNAKGFVAHEFIIDARPFKEFGIEAVDIAKRLQDYGFHSPTMSWPVPNTLMFEPTESESLEEVDRLCEALISIRKEIQEVQDGKYPKNDNVLKNAPHPLIALDQEWNKPYTVQKAFFPVKSLKDKKFWPSVARVDDTFGDRTLVCQCPPVTDY